MHDELNSMEISKKMIELTTLPFSPMNPSLPMKRKFNSSSHFRQHLTSASSDMSSEEHQIEVDECEDEYSDSRLLGRQNGTLVANGKLIGGLNSSKSMAGAVNIPSPPSSTRSSFDGLTRDSLLSNGDLGAESNSSEPDSSSEHVCISGSIAFDQSNDLFDEQPECQSELSSAEVASPLTNHEPVIDDEIMLLTADLVEKVCLTTEEESRWNDIKIDLDGETILPSGLRIVNGVADMPICRNSEEEAQRPPRFTNQLNFLKNILQKYICRYKTATPFLQPVDSVRYKIPHYYIIIRKPMDLNTVKNRLNFLWYGSAQECIDDIRQIFKNCYLFNAPTEFVYTSCQKLEEYFNEKLKDIPEPETEIPCPPRPNYDEYIKNLKKNSSKRRNTSVSDLETNSPTTPMPGVLTFTPIKMTTRRERGVMVRKPSKDLPATIVTPQPKKPSGRKVPLNDAMNTALEFVKELFTKQHSSFAWPFYEPVDLKEYPDYLNFVKKPIDLTTIKNNIETGKYLTINDFAKDMRLMISNCLRYNPPEAVIIEQARTLREKFEHFYAGIPEEKFTEKLSLPTKSGQSSRQSSASSAIGLASLGSPHRSKHNAGSESHYRHGGKGPKVKSPVKPHGQMDEAGQLFSSYNINSLEMDSNQRMKILENQVVTLTKALTSIVNQSVNAGINPQFLAQSMVANGAPVQNGGGRGRGRKANGNAPKRQYTKRANNKRKRHLSSDEDSEDEGQGGSLLSTINEPLAGPFDPQDINDLKQLKHDLEELSAADLQDVLRILQRSEPTLSCDDEQNVEIDFEKLHSKTLIALRKYVSSCQRNTAKKASANGKAAGTARTSTSKRQCHQSNARSHLDTDCDTPTTSNHWSRAGSRASNLQLSESSSDSEVD